MLLLSLAEKREQSPAHFLVEEYPQPRLALAPRFRLMFARTTPEFVAWMWCDGRIPMGMKTDPVSGRLIRSLHWAVSRLLRDAVRSSPALQV